MLLSLPLQIIFFVVRGHMTQSFQHVLHMTEVVLVYFQKNGMYIDIEN